MVTKTRYVGICQICEGEFKLDPKAGHTMVHHGYKRPGHGYIVGDCAGVGAPAYEQSCESLKRHVDNLKKVLESIFQYLEDLRAGKVEKLTKRLLSSSEYVDVVKGDPQFPGVLEQTIKLQEERAKWVQQDIAHCEARIAAWEPKPLRTVEEVARKAEESKTEAKARVEAERSKKVEDKIAAYQKRIDSALRTKNSRVIYDIFETAPGKLRQATRQRLSTAEALALLQRDHVWAAFGILVDGQISPEIKEIRSKMWNKEFWPEGL